MKMLLTFGMAPLVLFTLQPTQAQASNSDAQDLEFITCMEEWQDRGIGGTGAQFCYDRVYGSETSGGGRPNEEPVRTPTDRSVDRCWPGDGCTMPK